MLQMSHQGSTDQMLDAVEEKIHALASQSVHIVCLQELFASPYPCQSEDHRHFDYAESIDGLTVSRMQALAKQHQMVIVTPFFERRAAGLYHNSAVVIDADGSIAGLYRKMHIPDDPLFYEKFYFTPGDLGFNVIATRYAKLGVGICWDQWFPEAARLFALAGADILIYPTAIGWIHEEKQEFGAGQLDSWKTAMRAHCIANGLWLAAPNRVGTEGGIQFWGHSFVCSPSGQITAEASETDDETVVADCDLEMTDLVRTHWPFLRDRRIESYGDLSRRMID